MELEQEGIFLGLIKMSLIQENRKEARMQDLNSNSFEYHSNGFELGLGLVWLKMLRFKEEPQ